MAQSALEHEPGRQQAAVGPEAEQQRRLGSGQGQAHVHAAIGVLERPAPTASGGGRVVHCVAEEASAGSHPLRMHDGRAVRGKAVS